MLLSLLTLAPGAIASAIGKRGYPGEPSSAFALKEFTNLVAFGDSYTDEDRLSYFINNNGSAPPAGTLLPMSNSTAGGGITWDRWVSIYSGAELYDYAVSGAACSNYIVSRWFDTINADFPDVMSYEVPAFLQDLAYINTSTGTNTLFTDRTADNTVYSLWIGTNDLGNYAFITDSETPGTDITSFIDCTYEFWDAIYSAGGRYFVLMNTAPLELSPQYGLPGDGGVATDNYWPDKGSNTTEISYKMMEYTRLVNRIWDKQTPFEHLIAKRWPGAHFAIYDVHSLISDIYYNPASYLNGTSPYNVTGYYLHCDVDGNCFEADGDPDSFLWYDALHPSQRVDQIVASNFIDVVKGNSSYATYW